MDLFAYGADAVLAELPDGAQVPVLRDVALALPGVTEAVAGARTVLVEFDLALTSAPAVRAGLLSAPSAFDVVGDPSSPATLEVVLGVRYDGPDLETVAELAGLSRAEVIARHHGASYTVRFCGFAPGFAYLDGLDPALRVPRRDTPRSRVPAGSVAIAGEFAAVYPRSSPGGWQLLGTSQDVVWDPAAVPPALLSPGTRVRFEPR